MATNAEKAMDELKAAIAAVSDEHEADLLLYSGGIESPGDKSIEQAIRLSRSRKNAWLYLTTFGGYPRVAYRIARCIQRAYRGGRFSVVVDSQCKSAGTLIALGADQVVMSPLAELGPLDVQVTKPDALGEMTSA